MRNFISLSIAVVFAALLTGCAHAPGWLRPAQQFQVTLYQAGQVSASFRDSQPVLQIADRIEDENYGVADFGFSIEPAGSPRATGSVPTAATTVKVTLYSGGKAVRTWYAEATQEEYGKAFLQMPGSAYCTIVGGTFTIEPVAPATRSDSTGSSETQPQSDLPRCLPLPK